MNGAERITIKRYEGFCRAGASSHVVKSGIKSPRAHDLGRSYDG
jgi:hypothetical protein